MDTGTKFPDLGAGLNTLRKAGLAGAPYLDADDLAEAILEGEWESGGLSEPDLEDAARYWWAVDASDMLMFSYREGLRERARSAIEQRISGMRDCNPRLRDIDFPKDDDWNEVFIEEAAAAANLPPEDIVRIVAEFCPIRNEKHALFYAEVELRTYHRSPALWGSSKPKPVAEP